MIYYAVKSSTDITQLQKQKFILKENKKHKPEVER